MQYANTRDSRISYGGWAVIFQDFVHSIGTREGGWPIFALHYSHGACPILAFFARVGGDAAGATFVRSTLPVVDAVVVPALRKVREGRGTRAVVASAV